MLKSQKGFVTTASPNRASRSALAAASIAGLMIGCASVGVRQTVQELGHDDSLSTRRYAVQIGVADTIDAAMGELSSMVFPADLVTLHSMNMSRIDIARDGCDLDFRYDSAKGVWVVSATLQGEAGTPWFGGWTDEVFRFGVTANGRSCVAAVVPAP